MREENGRGSGTRSRLGKVKYTLEVARAAARRRRDTAAGTMHLTALQCFLAEGSEM
jgi:hypothetical protein